MGGNHARIEAPYIVYDPDTDCYYLFLSFGGLNVDDGYNLRVCRSHDVEGPYEDARGHDMRDCMCRPGNFWNDDDVAPYGVKLIFHGQDVNRVEHTSVAVTLSADGIVSGERTGSFASEDDRVTLTLDGTEYRGVATVGYDADQDAFVTALTALSKDGQAVWGLRATGQD